MYNILLVDDEKNIRVGILGLIDWHALNCKVINDSSDTSEAKDVFSKTKIDILITDIRMPGEDGLSLTQWVRHNYPLCQIILLSAYTDFEYAQQAIHYDTVAFVEKNNFFKELPQAVQKAQKRIHDEQMHQSMVLQLQSKVDEYKKANTEYLLSRLASSSNVSQQDVQMLDTNLRAEMGANQYYVLAGEIQRDKIQCRPADTSAILEELFPMVFPQLDCIIVPMDDIVTMVVLFTAETMPFSALAKHLNQLNVMMKKLTGGQSKFGCSEPCSAISDIANQYSQALTALALIRYCQDHFYQLEHNLVSGVNKSTICTNNYIDNAIALLLEDKAQESRAAAKQGLLDSLQQSSDIEQARNFIMLLTGLLQYRLLRYTLSETSYPQMFVSVVKKINESQSLGSLEILLDKIIENTASILKTQQPNQSVLVKKAQLFIQSNYRSNLSLEKLGAHLHVHPNYISHLYKKETGKNVIDAVNYLRIENAKQLLLGSEDKIYDIAQQVGFDDSAYFSRVFMKYTGFSPKKYKQIMANDDQ